MTLRAVERASDLNANPPLVVMEKLDVFFSLIFCSFIRVCKAPLTKPVSVVLALSPPFLSESRDHWKAIFGRAGSITVFFNQTV